VTGTPADVKLVILWRAQNDQTAEKFALPHGHNETTGLSFPPGAATEIAERPKFVNVAGTSNEPVGV
jgi:hypothetical protein